MSKQQVVVSEIMPSLKAFRVWLEAGGDPSAVPHVAFAAGHQSRDAEIEAADALADWVAWWLSARREEEQSKFSEMRSRLDAYRAARTVSTGGQA